MIQTKLDYVNYIQADKKALGRGSFRIETFIKELFFPDYIWKFQKRLRKTEYFKNCKKTYWGKINYILLVFRLRRLSVKLGFSIPLNVFGPGLAIAHYGTIVVSAYAKVGANCRIHPSTCIGASGGLSKAPQIGDNVYIAPGVKIYGDIIIGNNIAFAANAAVCSSYAEENILVGGIPAKKIKEIEISTIIKHLKK